MVWSCAMSLFRRGSTGQFRPDFDDCFDDLALRQARDAAVAGEWTIARDLLEETGQDWDRRGHRIDALAATAVEHPEWLRKWLDKEPASPDPQVIVSSVEVKRAWRVRGSSLARFTPREAFAKFHEVLEDAAEMCRQAVRAAPDDPTPWVTVLQLAIGQGHPPEATRAYWRELTARDPFNRRGHNVALQYWCDKWHGSHEQMYQFAREAAAAAPAGSPLAVLPLQAHMEYVTHLRSEYELQRRDGGKPNSADWARWAHHWDITDTRADITKAMEKWLAPYAGQAAHALAVHDRSVLALALVKAGWSQAATQFLAMGEYACEYPWYYEGDPAKEFVKARAKALRKGGSPA